MVTRNNSNSDELIRPGGGRLTTIARQPAQPIVLPWEDFQVMFLGAHRQGEHIAIVGPNGSGKTMLGLQLCEMVGSRRAKDGGRSRVTVLCGKPADDTLSRFSKTGWPIIKKWPPAYGEEHCIVWPRGGGPAENNRRQRQVFGPLLDIMYQEGNQCVYVIEAAHFERPQPRGLGLSATMEMIWSMARSNKLTLISDTQRPRHVTLLMWTEPQWLIIFPPDHEEDLKTVAAASGRKIDVWNAVPRLGEHEFLCVRRQKDQGKREIYVSRVDL